MTTKLAAIREVVIKANPEIERWCESCEQYRNSEQGWCVGCGKANRIHKDLIRPIRLSDILRATPIGIYLKTMGEYARLVSDDENNFEVVFWDLLQDDLKLQQPDVIDFLFSLLCHE